MAYSLSSLIKLTREELANIVLDYQHKFDNSLGSINAELLELKTKFTKMESDLTISRNVNVKLMERLVVTERKCWTNEQYSRRECLEISWKMNFNPDPSKQAQELLFSRKTSSKPYPSLNFNGNPVH